MERRDSNPRSGASPASVTAAPPRTRPPSASKGSLAEYKAILRLVATRGASTRPLLTTASGLSRSTVSQRVQDLIDAGVLHEAGESRSTGGRRATQLSIRQDAGLVLAVDLGATHAHIRIADLLATSRYDADFPLSISSGPHEVLTFVERQVTAILDEIGASVNDIRACGIGVPGPVNFAEGKPTRPPLMPGWDNVPVAGLLRQWLPAPVVLDNDVNIMALGDYEAMWRRRGWHDLLFVKHGTGIGCGIIASGDVHRGYDGAAGDIGHVAVLQPDRAPVTCWCGNLNCLEAIAGGQALVERLNKLGYSLAVASDIPPVVTQGDSTAMNLIREAGRLIAEVLTSIVNFFNPAAIVIGGTLGSVEQTLLAGMREVIYARATSLATRRLQIVPSHLGRDAGVFGATLLALDQAFDSVLKGVLGDRQQDD